jgi:hypothetical protein
MTPIPRPVKRVLASVIWHVASAPARLMGWDHFLAPRCNAPAFPLVGNGAHEFCKPGNGGLGHSPIPSHGKADGGGGVRAVPDPSRLSGMSIPGMQLNSGGRDPMLPEVDPQRGMCRCLGPTRYVRALAGRQPRRRHTPTRHRRRLCSTGCPDCGGRTVLESPLGQ